MYCPKCNKTIPDEVVEGKAKQLKDRFGTDELARGVCPVCHTKLIDPKRKGK